MPAGPRAAARRQTSLVRLSIALLVLGSAPLAAQRPDTVPAEVETVATGGWWERGAGASREEGRYRAVIRSSGFEHVISTLTIDWVRQATEDDPAPRLVASITVPSAGPVSLHDPEFARVGSEWVLTVTGSDSHHDPPRRTQVRIILGPPGVAKTSAPR